MLEHQGEEDGPNRIVRVAFLGKKRRIEQHIWPPHVTEMQ
jgi:hypothetical protein